MLLKEKSKKECLFDRYSIISGTMITVGMILLITYWHGIWRRFEVRHKTHNISSYIETQPQTVDPGTITIDAPENMILFNLAIPTSEITEMFFDYGPYRDISGKINSWSSSFIVRSKNYNLNISFNKVVFIQRASDIYSDWVDSLSITQKSLKELNRLSESEYDQYYNHVNAKTEWEITHQCFIVDQPNLKAIIIDYPADRQAVCHCLMIIGEYAYQFRIILTNTKTPMASMKDFLARVDPKKSSELIKTATNWNEKVHQEMTSAKYAFYMDPRDYPRGRSAPPGRGGGSR